MDDLDKTLDIMERDKSVSLLQENSVRTKKNNIKFTKINKKNSQEHLDAQLVSYERLVRNLIKQLLNLEKKIRLKYLIPMDEDRALKLMGVWNTEVECAVEDLSKKYICIFVKNIKEAESIVWSGRSPDQRKEYKMKAAKLNMNLKEIILNLLALVQQALLSKERRNSDLILKVKTKLEKLFQIDNEYDQIICRIKPFFEIV